MSDRSKRFRIKPLPEPARIATLNPDWVEHELTEASTKRQGYGGLKRYGFVWVTGGFFVISLIGH